MNFQATALTIEHLRPLVKPREMLCDLQSDYQEISEQVEIMKTMLSKAGNDHTRQQAENAGLAKELDAKRLRLDDTRKKVANNRRKLEGEYVHLDSLAAKEKELDTLANLEGKRLEEVCPDTSLCQCMDFTQLAHMWTSCATEHATCALPNAGSTFHQRSFSSVG